MSISLEMVYALGVVGVLFGFAGFMLGLWLGERGRRKDAQRREGVIHVDEDRPKPIVRGPSDAYDPRKTADSELAEAPERFIRETMLETGCSREDAEEEWRTLVSQGMGDGGQGWMQE